MNARTGRPKQLQHGVDYYATKIRRAVKALNALLAEAATIGIASELESVARRAPDADGAKGVTHAEAVVKMRLYREI